MADKSKIEWTDTTWNPVAGCYPVSRGCAHCYAARMAKRLAAMGQEKYLGTVDAHGRWTGLIHLDYDALRAPYSWRKPRRVFVCSMSDLFHEAVSWAFLQHVFKTMRENPQHTFQVLTKRPERMRDYLRHREPAGVPANVWLGVSVENQAMADERIPLLLDFLAAVRFLSCEPLVGPLRLPLFHGADVKVCPACLDGTPSRCDNGPQHCPLKPIQWVICGGESGPKAAPMHPDWARGLRDQCVAAGVPFFFKQWGGWSAIYDRDQDPGGKSVEALRLNHPKGRWLNLEGGHGFHGERVHFVVPTNKKLSGRLLDGREWNEFPGVAV